MDRFLTWRLRRVPCRLSCRKISASCSPGRKESLCRCKGVRNRRRWNAFATRERFLALLPDVSRKTRESNTTSRCPENHYEQENRNSCRKSWRDQKVVTRESHGTNFMTKHYFKDNVVRGNPKNLKKAINHLQTTEWQKTRNCHSSDWTQQLEYHILNYVVCTYIHLDGVFGRLFEDLLVEEIVFVVKIWQIFFVEEVLQIDRDSDFQFVARKNQNVFQCDQMSRRLTERRRVW